MKYQITRSFLVLVFCLSVLLPLFGETFRGPERTEPGAMFTVLAEFGPGETAGAKIGFDHRALQFLGAVVPSPDIQVRDGGVEIMPPSTGGGSRSFALKFLPISQASSTEILLQTGARTATIRVQFISPEVKSSYHLHLLVIGLVLLLVGLWFWKTQKKHVGLMSTRSLFLNFEELEKVRGQMFPAGQDAGVEGGEKRAEPLSKAPEGSRLPEATKVAQVAPSSADPFELETVLQMPAAAGGPCEIVLVDGSGRRFSGIGNEEITIGRKNTCTIVLTAAEVSRNHCVLQRKGTGWTVVSLTSTNQTDLNGALVKEKIPLEIKTGDTLSLGGTPFVVEIRNA